MTARVGILLVEDDPTDARLIEDTLAAGNLAVAIERVESRPAFEAALRQGGHALILSDYKLPAFDGLAALRLARERRPEVPFILVSGTLGEEMAVDALLAGATDYVLKHRLARLVPAVNRALSEADEHRRRREAEEALRESQALYESLVEQLPQSVFRKDREGRFTFGNRRFCELLGVAPDDLRGKTDFDFFPPDLAEKYRQDDEWVRELGRVFSALERQRLPGETEDRFVEVVKWPVRTAQRLSTGIQCIFWDVTERKRAEDQLRKLARAVEQSPASIVITDRTGAIEFVNPKFTQVTGYTAAEVQGQNSRILKSGETSPEEYRRLWETILDGREWRGEFHNRRKDGTLYWEAASISAIRDAAGTITHFIGVKEDITEQKLTQAKLLRAQRVESIGSLASGIAHDLNNILTPILMCAPMLPMEDAEGDRLELIRTIESSAQRAAGIVQQLMSFARGREGLRQPVQIRHMLTDITRMARETFPRNIKVEAGCEPDLWLVQADATQMHQVLLNLCLNARDAMPNGGRLTLGAENITLDAHFVSMHKEARPGPHVRLDVQDTGTGILEEARQHVFESFFTTKGEGLGTGLGLATVKGIVLDHGGFVSFRTASGHGTTFSVYLPAADVQPASPDAATERAAPRGRGELILVVDDEPAICETTHRTLVHHGYAALSAWDGIQALATFSAHSPAVRAVITDHMMPLMDGVTLCRALRALSPQTPVIVSTGGLFGKTGDEAVRAFEQLGVRHILHKPHNAHVLLWSLADVLGHNRPAAGPGAAGRKPAGREGV